MRCKILGTTLRSCFSTPLKKYLHLETISVPEVGPHGVLMSKMQLKKSYHDWNIVDIATDNESYQLDLKLAFGHETAILRFHHVKQCLIDHFMIGNIILNISLFSGERKKVARLVKSLSFCDVIGVKSDTPYFQETVEAVM